jgi:hypothetical protein
LNLQHYKMNKKIIILLLIISTNICFSRTRSDIDTLLNSITTTNSKRINTTIAAKKIIAKGTSILSTLSTFFTDASPTKIYSECHNRTLTKGEVAIIIADKIKRMPYFEMTGIQNCTLTFCDNNPNLIEYYFSYIDINEFQSRYNQWLKSEEKQLKTK